MNELNRREFVKTTLKFAAGAATLTLIPTIGQAVTIKYRIISMKGFFGHNHRSARFLDNDRIRTGWGGGHTHGTIKISRRSDKNRIVAEMQANKREISFKYLDHTVIMRRD